MQTRWSRLSWAPWGGRRWSTASRSSSSPRRSRPPGGRSPSPAGAQPTPPAPVTCGYSRSGPHVSLAPGPGRRRLGGTDTAPAWLPQHLHRPSTEMTMSETTATPTEAPTHEIEITDVAAQKVKTLLAQEGRDDLRLRIAVQPGGCSGLIYQLDRKSVVEGK